MYTFFHLSVVTGELSTSHVRVFTVTDRNDRMYTKYNRNKFLKLLVASYDMLLSSRRIL